MDVSGLKVVPVLRAGPRTGGDIKKPRACADDDYRPGQVMSRYADSGGTTEDEMIKPRPRRLPARLPRQVQLLPRHQR